MGRDPYIEVDGPPQIKPLHDFQETICARIHAHLLREPPGRGLLALPTGSGKTRVVVEAVVRAMKSLCPRGHILWVSETDELCEQAVQTWSEVWRALGPRQQLRISRFWGNTSDRIENIPTANPHVIVATYQLLGRRLHDITFRWVFDNPGCVLVDEAHRAIVPTYTRFLEEVELTFRETKRPLVGMTATPFRGVDEAETRRLVARFGGHRFDADVFDGKDPYDFLQDKGVLARVDHRLLEGAELSLNSEEKARVEKPDIRRSVLPPSAERRLAWDSRRNERILECLSGLSPEWSIVVFAASVEHAKHLAVSLCMRGVSSQAISSDTPLGARRYYIDEFRAGRLRVLTNYGVLTTGFDAPAVRAICIARPVYSCGLYQQMIGRGLRGPQNGGKERCLIVDVKDNILNYHEQLAFYHFEPLWRNGHGIRSDTES